MWDTQLSIGDVNEAKTIGEKISKCRFLNWEVKFTTVLSWKCHHFFFFFECLVFSAKPKYIILYVRHAYYVNMSMFFLNSLRNYMFLWPN